jgi:hypothetical protein
MASCTVTCSAQHTRSCRWPHAKEPTPRLATGARLRASCSLAVRRWLVFYVFPVFCTSVLILRGIVLFKRVTIVDKEVRFWKGRVQVLHAAGPACKALGPGANRPGCTPLRRGSTSGSTACSRGVPSPGYWCSRKVRTATAGAMRCWLRGASSASRGRARRAGHRSIKPKSLPLKRGMMHYAYSRKMPVQVMRAPGGRRRASEPAAAQGVPHPWSLQQCMCR